MNDKNDWHVCKICGNIFPRRELVRCGSTRDSIENGILGDKTTGAPEDFICKHELTKLGADHVKLMLASEQGELILTGI
jgi:hypothetical protein